MQKGPLRLAATRAPRLLPETVEESTRCVSSDARRAANRARRVPTPHPVLSCPVRWPLGAPKQPRGSWRSPGTRFRVARRSFVWQLVERLLHAPHQCKAHVLPGVVTENPNQKDRPEDWDDSANDAKDD